MRHNSSSRRSRGRGRKGNAPRMQVYDSNGPEVRIRGTAYQVTEKYLALAKDAASAGDNSLAQNYLQHAEHYQRIINSYEAEMAAFNEKKEAAKEEQKEDLGLPETMIKSAGSKEEAKELETA